MDLNMQTHHACGWKGNTEMCTMYHVLHYILYDFLFWLGLSCRVTIGLEPVDSTLHHFSYHSVDRNPTHDRLLLWIKTHIWLPWIVKGFPYNHPTLCIIHLQKQDYKRNRARVTVPDSYWSGYVVSSFHNAVIREKQVCMLCHLADQKQ